MPMPPRTRSRNSRAPAWSVKVSPERSRLVSRARPLPDVQTFSTSATQGSRSLPSSLKVSDESCPSIRVILSIFFREQFLDLLAHDLLAFDFLPVELAVPAV